MDFDFIMPEKVGSQVDARSNLEHWIPLSESPRLNKQERNAILYKPDVVETLYLVKPGFLQPDENGGITYVEAQEIPYYLIAAKLHKSPYMVLLGDYEKSQEMDAFLKLKFNPKTTHQFYFDPYFSPNFGMVRPRYFLFEKVKLKSIPNTCVLFRQL